MQLQAILLQSMQLPSFLRQFVLLQSAQLRLPGQFSSQSAILHLRQRLHYARCALARYDQLSYDLDSLPVLPCNPSCYPCGSCCGCPYPCPPTTPAPNPNPCPNAPSYLNAVNDPEQTVASGSPVLFASDRVSSGNCIQHTAGTSNFTLNCPGVYLV